MLAAEKSLAITLAVASVAIGLVQLAEPILFGRVVDALSRGDAAFPIIAMWAALGLFGILASVVVAVYADRAWLIGGISLPWQRPSSAPSPCRPAITPTGARAPSYASILQGTDALFLGSGSARCASRLTAIVGIVLLGADRHQHGYPHGRHPRAACAGLRRP